MQKVAPALVLPLLLAGSACLVPADDADELSSAEPEHATETSGALIAHDPEAAAWLRENVPQWDVYLGGRGHDLHPGKDPWNGFTNVYYEDPRDSDVFAPVILVRKGDEDSPHKWIQLSLTQHWMKGDRYFDELIACGTLTVMDLLVVMAEMSKYADSYIEPKPIRVLQAATREALRDLMLRSRSTCKDEHAGARLPNLQAVPDTGNQEAQPLGPQLPPPWPPGPDTHTYGPGPAGPVDAYGHPRPVDVASDRPSLSQAPPNPSPPRMPEQNGVRPGDPRPKPSPYDKEYRPRPGEVKETFKCNGEVYHGYKAGCADLSNRAAAWKWQLSGGSWMLWDYQDIHGYILHAYYNDGKNPECMQGCNRLSKNWCTAGLALSSLIAYAVTRGAAFTTGPGAVTTSVVGIWGGTHCLDFFRDRCATDICTR
jgi:hypothetical protein